MVELRTDEAEDATERLGIAEAPMGLIDPGVMARSLVSAVLSTRKHPLGVAAVGGRLVARSAQTLLVSAGRLVGVTRDGPAGSMSGDKRFGDQAFEENAFYFLLAQEYLLGTRALDELLDLADVGDDTAGRARFAGQFLGDALSPTHTPLGNPAVMRRAFDTNGKSLVRGGRSFVRDIRRNGGWPSQVDTSGFQLGRNMAATAGKVVHRSELIEVIEYEPQTEQCYELPLVFCPPWINKYYLMDLAPGRSLIEWALQHGHRSFAISYRNPDRSMRDLGFDDYLHDGFFKAIDVVREITGAPQVNTVSACLGGTLTAIGLAYGAQTGEHPVRSATFLNTHTDFTEAGDLGLFIDEAAVGALERRMEEKGYLDAKEMAHTFDALRARDLIFAYLISGWLLGDLPPSFDLLAWNNDSTRMPFRMHSQYLRSFYLNNEFARGEFEVDGYKLDPSAADVDAYVVGAIGDHIVPWGSAFKTSQLLGGTSRFVLSSSGHIAGIVNPPSTKARYWTNENGPTGEPVQWLAEAEQHQQTWWEDWARWISQRSGDLGDRPSHLGSSDNPPLCDAPGTYVSAVPS